MEDRRNTEDVHRLAARARRVLATPPGPARPDRKVEVFRALIFQLHAHGLSSGAIARLLRIPKASLHRALLAAIQALPAPEQVGLEPEAAQGAPASHRPEGPPSPL